MKLDAIEKAVALAEAQTGTRSIVAKIPLCVNQNENKNARFWSKEDRDYIRRNYGRISEEQIADDLGRSFTAIHIQVTRELHLTAPSKRPDVLTAEQVSWGVGLDGKSIHQLMDTGRMPCRLLPCRRKIRIIDRQVFMRWLLDPMNWVYVNPDRVGALRPKGLRELTDYYDFAFWESARKVVLKASAEWKDEWLTPGQAAEAIGIKYKNNGSSHNINKAILVGNLKAVRWGNWRILRSNLPPDGMTFNVTGRIVRKNSINKVSCGKCGKLGHNKRSC